MSRFIGHLFVGVLITLLTLGCSTKRSEDSNNQNVAPFTLEVKATITSNNTQIKIDEPVRLEVIHNAGLVEKFVWYRDNGSNEIELQSDVSPVLMIDNFSTLDEGIYRVDVYVDGKIVASDIVTLSIAEEQPTPTPFNDGSESGTFLELSAQSIGVVKNVFQAGDDIFIKADHDYVDFDEIKWSFDDGGGEVDLGTDSSTHGISGAMASDSGEYFADIIRNGSIVASASLVIQVVGPVATGFTTCADDPDSCLDPIQINNNGVAQNCPAGHIPTSCHGKQEQACFYDEAEDGFKCTDGGDGNGCYLYCHDVAKSALEKSVLVSGGSLDFFKAVQFLEEDGQVSCGPGFIPTGCSGFEDQSCHATTFERFECEDNGSGDEQGCQLMCWQVHDSTNRTKTVLIGGDDEDSCGTGYVPTGCSGDDEDFCRPKGNGVFKCVDDFFGNGCELQCVKVD